MLSRKTPQLLFIAIVLAMLAGLTACSPPPPEYTEVPEPTSALRPVDQRGEVPEEARIADYVLDAKLDGETHQITGQARLTWRNTTDQTVTTLPFHLYMNGFRAEDTAWMSSSGGRHRGNDRGKEIPWGYIDVHSVHQEKDGLEVVDDEVEDAPNLVELAYAEDEDPSTMTVQLQEPIGPGESITVALEFTTQLPEIYARTGHKGDFHAIAQWFPKIGVLDDDGWNAHTFTYHDEFFASFGHYTVFLDVPENMVVGATGIRTAEEIVDGRKRLTYEAAMVHDFAIFADPDFVETWAEYNGIRVRQLIQPEKIADAEIHFDAQLAAFETYERLYGEYPWSTLTIIHVPDDAGGAGGMEYPTLYTTSDIAPIPKLMREYVLDENFSGVFTTIHEFGHQYFQGLFASREHAEPWLDEGMNSFSNQIAMTDWLGEDGYALRLMGQELKVNDILPLSMGMRGFLQPVDEPASAFGRDRGNYGTAVYQQPAALFMTLRNLVGAERFDEAFAVYCEKARFDHPRGDDLIATLHEELGPVNLAPEGQPEVLLNVEEYLEQALRTTRRVEFEVLNAVNRRLMGDDGYQRGEDGTLARNDLDEESEEGEAEEGETKEGETEEGADEGNREERRNNGKLSPEESEAVVVLHRLGSFEVPVEVEIELNDRTELRVWDARERTVVWKWPGQRVKRVHIDPSQKLLLENKKLDNMMYARGEEESDGLSKPLGDTSEALVLAALGGLLP